MILIFFTFFLIKTDINSIRRRETVNASTKKQGNFTHSPTKKGNGLGNSSKSPTKTRSRRAKASPLKGAETEKNIDQEAMLASPTSISMKKSFII